MRIRIPVAVAVVSLVALALWSCDPAVKPATDPVIDPVDGTKWADNAVPVGSDITTATTWSADKVYCIRNGVAVSATLTIEAGTVVKFGSSGKLTAVSGGSIVAVGRSDAPIVFTSIRDKTNGDSVTNDEDVAAAKGDWLGIVVADGSTGNSFAYCDWRYAGGVDDVDKTAALRINGAAVVAHCSFHDNLCGLPWNTFEYATLDARACTLGSTSITDCVFYGNVWPLAVAYDFALGSSNAFSYDHDADPATDALKNKHQAIFLDSSASNGNNVMTGTISWEETEVPFCIFDAIGLEPPASGSATSSLTVADDAVIKFGTASSGLTIDVGTAFTPGNAVYTSFYDDAHGGDSDADGGARAPQEGDWGTIWVPADFTASMNIYYATP